MSLDDDTEPWAFGNQYPGDFDAEDCVTHPAPGSGKLLIQDKFEPLFISATWSLIATVNGNVVEKTKDSDKPHSKEFIERWARHFIRTNSTYLKNLGVDIDLEYQKWGGNLEDLF